MSTTEYDIGNTVLCDFCDEDYSFSSEKGGIIFQSKGVCPKCCPDFLVNVRKYGEEEFIRAKPKPDESFRDFILRIRDGNNKVTITTLEKVT